MSRIFLSHSSHDNRQAIALKRWLEHAEPSLVGEILLDLDSAAGIRTGQRWTEALWQANTRCEAVICLLSRSWATSAECLAEYRQADGMRKPILVARIEEFDGADVTRAWQRCDLFGDGPAVEVVIDGDEQSVRLREEGLQRLLSGLLAAGIGADSFPWPPPEDHDRSPYRGWQPLESVDAAVHFGRDTQTAQALDELRQMRLEGHERLFVILGPSGVGKSSFLRAGILPHLLRDDRHFQTMPIVRPERHPLTGDNGLARSIHRLRAAVGITAPSLGEIKGALTDQDQVRAWLVEAAGAARSRLLDGQTQSPTLVLPVDQAEELFGADANEESATFLTLLSVLLADAGTDLDMVVVATIRSDRYEPLQTASQLSAVQSHLFDRLKPMPQAQFTEVICGPARRAVESGSTFALSSDLVDRLAEDASSGADTLPLLALTLSRLYEDYSGSADPVTVDRYEAMGGMRRVVQTEIDNLLSADPSERSEQLDRLHDAFIPWLTTVNPDTDQPMRRIARWADLPEESHDLVNAFVGRRLLVKGQREGQVVVEVALESLLSQWDELASWLQAEATDLRDADATERAAVAWERSGKRDDWLFDGARLDGAETLSSRADFGARLNPASEFLLASRRRAHRQLEDEKLNAQAHARSLRRRSQILAALLLVIVVVAAVAIVSFVRAQSAERDALKQARQATAAKLVGESRAMLAGARVGGDRRAIQQMLSAERLVPESDPGALLDTVNDERRLVRVIATPADTNGVAVSPDGRQIVSAGSDHLLRRWNPESGEPIGEPMTGHTDSVDGVVASKDWIVSVGADRTVRIWNAGSGAQVRGLTMPDEPWSIALSQDGSRLATAGKDGIIRLWEVPTGNPVGDMAQNMVSAVEFSPDGTLLVSGGWDGAVQLWDVASRAPAAAVLPRHEGAVTSFAFSSDGRKLASVSVINDAAGTVSGKTASKGRVSQLRVTEVGSGRPIVDGIKESGYGAISVAFNPDGKTIAIGADDHAIRIRDAETGAAIGTPLTGTTEMVDSIVYGNNGSTMISSGDNNIHVWTADPDHSVGKWLGPFSGIFGLTAVSPDGSILATRDPGKQADLTLWRTDTGDRFRDIATGHSGWIRSLAWRADGQVIASSGEEDNSIRMFNALTGVRESDPLPVPSGGVVTMSFSSDGKRFAAGSEDGSVWLWDMTANPAQPQGLPGSAGAVTTIEFSAGGHRVMAVAQTHTQSGNADALEGATSLATSPEAGTDSSVRVWETATGEAAGPPVIGKGADFSRWHNAARTFPFRRPRSAPTGSVCWQPVRANSNSSTSVPASRWGTP